MIAARRRRRGALMSRFYELCHGDGRKRLIGKAAARRTIVGREADT
jgi:hypothetical protein